VLLEREQLTLVGGIIFNTVNRKALSTIKRELLQMRQSPQGRKAADLISLAERLGRTPEPGRKEPTYTRAAQPALQPPLTIPRHGAKDIKVGTAKNIINMLLDDVSTWEIYLNEVDGDDD
jgi:hypothetical protein